MHWLWVEPELTIYNGLTGDASAAGHGSQWKIKDLNHPCLGGNEAQKRKTFAYGHRARETQNRV
jgi:hypothetical protein